MKKPLHKQIHTALKRVGNRERAELDKRYHKYDGYVSFGLMSEEWRGIMKEFKNEIKELSCDEVFETAGRLYELEIEETTLAGNYILELRRDCLDKKALRFIDKNLDHFKSWSTIDDFCNHAMQTFMIEYPKETLEYLKKWNKSKNNSLNKMSGTWRRRVSVVAFTRQIGASGKFTKEALALCDNLIWDKEDLVLKGVGWCLKDIMKGGEKAKKQVLNYVKKLRKLGVSSVVTLYAIRDLEGVEREEVLAISK